MKGKTEADTPDEEAALLWPEATLTLGGREVTVREISWYDSMRLAEHWKPLAVDLFDRIDGEGGSEQLDAEAFQSLFAERVEAVVVLLEASTDLSAAEIKALGAEEGTALLVEWMGVHMRFFARHWVAAGEMAAGIRQARQAMVAAGSASSRFVRH